jgi:drug/metabolite transporter (DMT)-like permease
MLLALAAGACFGLSNVVGRMAIARSSVYHVAFWSVLVTVAVLSLPLAWLGASDQLGSSNLEALPYFVGAGFAADFVARFSLYAASARIGGSRAAAFRVLTPIVTVSFGVLVFGDRLSAFVALGVALMVLGLGFVHGDVARRAEALPVAGGSSPPARASTWLARQSPAGQGLVFGLLAGLAFGAGDLLRKGGIDAGGNALVGVFIASTTALILYLGRGLATGGMLSPFDVSRTALPMLALTGLCVLFALVLFFSSLRLIPVGVASSVSGTQVLFAIIFGWLLNQRVERVSRFGVLGGLLVFGGFLMLMNV